MFDEGELKRIVIGTIVFALAIVVFLYISDRMHVNSGGAETNCVAVGNC